MDDTDEPSFSGQEAAEAQSGLRRVLGLEPEQFPLREMIGMLSDEIEQLREAGKDDLTIAKLLSELTGKPITAAQVGAYYASPEARGHFGGEDR